MSTRTGRPAATSVSSARSGKRFPMSLGRLLPFLAPAQLVGGQAVMEGVMMRNGDVGRLFAAHGSYLQDWMLLESDYNWRVDSAQGGASRAMADIGSHWCDTVQFMTGRRIVEVMADLSIVWPTRQAPVAGDATFSQHRDGTAYEARPVDTEDLGSVLFRFDDGSKGSFIVSQVSAGRKNGPSEAQGP